jgi:hypothetical protein
MDIPQQSVALLFHIQRATLIRYAVNSQSFRNDFKVHTVVTRCRVLYMPTLRRPFAIE